MSRTRHLHEPQIVDGTGCSYQPRDAPRSPDCLKQRVVHSYSQFSHVGFRAHLSMPPLKYRRSSGGPKLNTPFAFLPPRLASAKSFSELDSRRPQASGSQPQSLRLSESAFSLPQTRSLRVLTRRVPRCFVPAATAYHDAHSRSRVVCRSRDRRVGPRGSHDRHHHAAPRPSGRQRGRV